MNLYKNMDEILKRDQNHVTVLAGVTNDSNQEIKMLRVNPSTKALLVEGTVSVQEIDVFSELGSSIKGQVYGMTPNSVTGNAGGLSDGTLGFIVVPIDTDCTITGVMWAQNAQGVYTADNYNGIGLYSYSAGTLTKIAESTDDGNIWKGSTATLQTKNFSSPVAVTAGLYFVAFLYNSSAQTTSPSIAGQSSNAFIAAVFSLDFTNSAKLRGSVSSQTTLPATQAMSGVTAVTSYPWFALY